MGDLVFLYFFIIIFVSVILLLFFIFVAPILDRSSGRRYRFRQSSEEIGKEGEFLVKHLIGDTVENEKYVINNLTLEKDGKSSQIDHIVINPRGVFVIETKNYKGQIYGGIFRKMDSKYMGTQI